MLECRPGGLGCVFWPPAEMQELAHWASALMPNIGQSLTDQHKPLLSCV
jgi:hypothetical protein